MSIPLLELTLYAGGIFILFLTPGPVWVAIVARTLAGGVAAAWPLALGVAVGDMVWPLLAILGVTWLAGAYGDYTSVFKWVACLIFLIMGAALMLNADKSLGENVRLSRPGAVAGFLAGVAVIIGNPKAILFYLGILPGLFDMTQITVIDIIIIVMISAFIPMSGNLCLSLMVSRVRGLLQSPRAIRRTNLISGGLLVGVGLLIPWT